MKNLNILLSIINRFKLTKDVTAISFHLKGSGETYDSSLSIIKESKKPLLNRFDKYESMRFITSSKGCEKSYFALNTDLFNDKKINLENNTIQELTIELDSIGLLDIKSYLKFIDEWQFNRELRFSDYNEAENTFRELSKKNNLKNYFGLIIKSGYKRMRSSDFGSDHYYFEILQDNHYAFPNQKPPLALHYDPMHYDIPQLKYEEYSYSGWGAGIYSFANKIIFENESENEEAIRKGVSIYGKNITEYCTIFNYFFGKKNTYALILMN